ncbi:hypothetical protein [Photobacterium leiognathi]|uniref:hypothetical protein n=1 Tax=Photobacterium leiognathi TaxID=553611 RepID=UPI002981AB5A|nr:hypothetical protein [Photobacterium leiognathi]
MNQYLNHSYALMKKKIKNDEFIFSDAAYNDFSQDVTINTHDQGITISQLHLFHIRTFVAEIKKYNYKLTNDMCTQYPQVNTYRVLFRRKSYVFKFGITQMTHFIEGNNEHT